MLLGNSLHRSGWLVAVTIAASGCLNILPLGWLGGWFQPDWMALVLIYWCIHEPDRIGVTVGWLGGLLLDLLGGGILGRHALGKTVLAFAANKVSLRFRAYPLWQQCLGVAALIFVQTLVYALVRVLLAEPPLPLALWLTPAASMIMWPLVVVVLSPRSRSRRYG